ncbi:MAG TPA: arginine--tRNA ligase, partial [Anaerolineales bacterium]|nr:arginine--tRNA ligase [Anaerolineales bacterium]
MFESDLNSIADSIRKIFAGQGINFADEIKWQSTPFAGRWGMGTNVCFQAAAVEARSGKKVNVPARAAELATQVANGLGVPPGFDRVVADKAYVNVYFDTSTYAARVVDTGINAGENFGRGALKNERLMVEYAQPNTHHSFHIGHARNAILGEVLARIAAFAGFDVIRASYPGDMGLTVITCVWAYAKFYKGQEPPGLHERGRWIAKVYHEAHKLVAPKEDETPEEKAQREAYDAERREWNRRWDAGDPEVRELWRATRQWSLDELADILQMLDIKIDVFFYESEVDEPSKAIVDELIAKGIADDERPSGGPVIVKIDEKLGLKKEKYRTNVILRSDGTTLYSTKDLALAKMKFEKYYVDHSIYVVDARQSLHLQQAFKILELWGYKQAAKCFHLAYGVVTLPEGAMSSRKGNVIYFTDVLDEAIRRVLAVIAEKNPDLAEAERATVARQVGLGALVYAMLAVDNHKDIVF